MERLADILETKLTQMVKHEASMVESILDKARKIYRLKAEKGPLPVMPPATFARAYDDYKVIRK